MTLLFQSRMTDCSRWNVVSCHQSQMPPDASRQMPPGARCRQMPVARYQLPDVPPRAQRGPGGGGSVERQSWCPLPWSRVTCCRRQFWGPPDCDDERRAPAVKSVVPLLSMSAVKRFCSALSFRRRVLQTFITCGPSVADLDGSFTACGPSVTDLDGCKQTLPAMASGGGGGGGSSGGLGQLQKQLTPFRGS